MKRIFIPIIFALTVFTHANAQSDWRPLKADNRVVVSFPSTPLDVNGNFTATDAGNISYTFKVVDMVKIFGIDSVALAPIKQTAAFTAKLKLRINKNLPGISLGDIHIGDWRGFTSYIVSGSYNGKRYDAFMFIIGNRLYALSTLIPAGTDPANRDKFFASASLTK